MYAHGTISKVCQVVNFTKDEYLSKIEIAIDGSAKTINRLIITKTNRIDSKTTAVTIGSLRSKKDKSVKTKITEAADATFKTYGIEGWSVDGLLTGLRWVSIDPAPYAEKKQT